MADGLRPTNRPPRPSILGATFVDWSRLYEETGADLFEEDEAHAHELAGVLRLVAQRLTLIARRLDKAMVDG